MEKRLVVLDTETTGLSVKDGNRVIEIGAVEFINREPTGRTFHEYMNPEREIEAGAQDVHGITLEFLSDKPTFGQIAEDFLAFIKDADLVIHNAAFDLGFLNKELSDIRKSSVEDVCGEVIDSLKLARGMRGGGQHSLDALCRRYKIDNTGRDKHGALLDAQLLSEVYMAMTAGQLNLGLGDQETASVETETVLATDEPASLSGREKIVVYATEQEEAAHEKMLDSMSNAIWRQLATC